jgi:hypothetical protein
MAQSYTADVLERTETFGGVSLKEKARWDAPEEDTLHILAEHLIDNIGDIFGDSCLALDLDATLRGVVDLFHNAARKIERELDVNVIRQRELAERQDGSEVASVELEETHDIGLSLQKRLAAMESLRDFAAETLTDRTGAVWLPRNGSKTSGKALTAAMIDARDFANARDLDKKRRLMPEGKKIVVAGGKCDDVAKIFSVLDKTLAKLQGRGEKMVLLHGGAGGAEKIASQWANNRNVPQIVFKPDWNKHDKAAPFKRNDEMLATLPAFLIMANKEGGIHEQLLRGAKKLGVPIKEI